ncbi:MAG: hypothetical protein EOP56_18895 [Sphingobacteriales bacterium]|nr:MAG: hypothetical protein EOP56_18895 [Sphingobacteriales bacterium]
MRRALLMPVCKHSRKLKMTAAMLWCTMVAEMIFPNVSYALTGGPTQPDFGSFEPVGTTNMVNEFTGQFVYNIPVIEIPGGQGGGYALSLSYHSGDGPESEASWVGSGWTLNPGSISHIKRGLPDDYKNKVVGFHNSMPKNWTVAATGIMSLQIFSKFGGNLGLNQTVRYNNYRGFGFTSSVNLTALRGLASVGYHLSPGDGTFSVGINPVVILSYASDAFKKSRMNGGNSAGRQTGMDRLATSGVGRSMYRSASAISSGAASRYVGYLLSDMSSPYNVTPYTGNSVYASVEATLNPGPLPAGTTLGVGITYTSQQQNPLRWVKTYGYMYSGNARAEGNDNTTAAKETVMDYTVDRPSPYHERDRFLPVPVNTADAYFVSGEGIGGAFRMYHEKVGVFSPNYVESKTGSSTFDLDIHSVGMNGVGMATKPKGEHMLKVGAAWPEGKGNMEDVDFIPYGYVDNEHKVLESQFFRFNNDLGGSLNYANETPEGAGFTKTGPKFPEMKQKGGRSGRASYIGYHTNAEINQRVGNKRMSAYEMNERVHDMAGRNTDANAAIDDVIGEVAVYNEEGNAYVYGLPVYGKDEKYMQHGVANVSGGGYVVNSDISENYKKVGEEYIYPYATSYLLTQITTPDYVDINLNGPDKEDLGGYTRFAYKPWGGSTSQQKFNPTTTWEWYKWRIPYTGVQFQPNRLSDNTDNMGGYQSGRREVYYLDTIETRTHYAVFETSSRQDGYSAHFSDVEAAKGRIPSQPDTSTLDMMQFGRPLQKLDKIKVYAKSLDPNQPDQLIKTVRFQYDYEQWPNTPNTRIVKGQTTGKLTLKRVWFEHNGVVNASVSPYEFEYSYPSTPYPSKYQDIYNDMHDGYNQTPNYQSEVDCWGNYMSDGAIRRGNLLCAPDQTPNGNYDPGAWQLKRIILPSGGEIHVQYEQNSYAYVQDKPASILMPLTTTSGSTNNGDGSVFELNTLEAQVSSTADKQRLVALINETYRGKKIYYKFLYTLLGNSTPNINSCNADYVDGYADFQEARINVSGNVEVVIGDELPSKVCLDYIKREVGGKLLNGDCSPAASMMTDPGGLEGVKTIAQQFIKSVITSLSAKPFTCKKLSAPMSYFRVPVWKKLGGGIRVKRLMMYNSGTQAGVQSLFGHEYVYENEVTGESYGVATNEPMENAAENPLVYYMDKRTPQANWKRLFDGRDRDQFEGPLSMSALPAPSVGYSRVIKKNIHQDRYTGGGYTVLDYYTAKDFPVDGFYGDLNDAGNTYSAISRAEPEKEVEIGLFSYTIKTAMRSTQGFCFVQNQMHGQARSVAEYPGMYTSNIFHSTAGTPTPVAQQTWEYFAPGEAVPMFDAETYSVNFQQAGKEMDVTMESRCVAEEGSETYITGDATVAPSLIPAFAIAFPVTSNLEASTASAIVSKTIHYPAIVKRTTSMKDGIMQQKDNLAFDPLSMQAVVTRTYDGYNKLSIGPGGSSHNGTYTDYNILASTQYMGMGQKAGNERYVFHAPSSGLINISGGGSAYIATDANKTRMFQEGDLVSVHTTGGIALANVTEANFDDLKLTPAGRYNTTIPVGAICWKIEVVRSGFTNQLRASMGGMTTYGEQGDGQSGTDRFMADLNKMWLDVKAHNDAGDLAYYGVLDIDNYGFELYDQDGIDCSKADFRVTKLEIHSVSSGIYDMQAYHPLLAISCNPYTYNNYSHYVFTNHPANITTPPSQNCGFPTWSNIVGLNCPPKSLDRAKAVNGFGWTRTWITPGWSGVPGTPVPPHIYYHDKGGNCVEFYLRHCNIPSVTGVLRANVTTYHNNWPHNNYLATPSIPSVLNDYEKNIKNKWRPKETYVYNTKAIEGSNVMAMQRNYTGAGVADVFDLRLWKVIYLFNPQKWMKTNEVKSYSPHGFATEDVDGAGRPSSIKYGYHDMLPYLKATNATYKSTMFEGFEMNYGTKLEEGVIVPNLLVRLNSSTAHTGRRSLWLLPGNPLKFTVDDPANKGHNIRVWVRFNNLDYNNPSSSPIQVFDGGGSPLTVKYVTRTGEWELYEAVSNAPGAPFADFTISTVGLNELIIDDIRIQPIESESSAYVYDTRNYRMSATLDDNNFATFYQYNGEGKLVRKIIETERGPKTVDEVQLNTPKLRDRTVLEP